MPDEEAKPDKMSSIYSLTAYLQLNDWFYQALLSEVNINKQILFCTKKHCLLGTDALSYAFLNNLQLFYFATPLSFVHQQLLLRDNLKWDHVK